jgi:hypothetical protein
LVSRILKQFDEKTALLVSANMKGKVSDFAMFLFSCRQVFGKDTKTVCPEPTQVKHREVLESGRSRLGRGSRADAASGKAIPALFYEHAFGDGQEAAFLGGCGGDSLLSI